VIAYKKAGIDECELLAKTRVDFLCETNNGMNDIEKELLYQNNKLYMASALANGSFVAWIAVEGEKIVATSGISFYALPPNRTCLNGQIAYISNMFTYPEYRNRGIATKLFALTVEEAKKTGCAKILLNATDMGRPIYKKLGFTDTQNEMVYYVL